MRLVLAASLLLFACEREPAIVIHFDAPDAAKHVASDAAAVPTATTKGAECTTDADCAVVADGACDCNRGGKQRAVTKLAAAHITKDKKTMCVAMLSNDPSCAKHAACVAGACSLTP